MSRNGFIEFAVLLAAFSAPAVARADNGTWTMPYGGSCAVGNPCVNVVNETGGGTAIQGWSDQSATGVYGHTGTGYGVHGDSTSGAGVYATSANGSAVFAFTGSGYALYASNRSSGTPAVLATNGGGGSGVQAFANNGGAALYGSNVSGGYAVYANGNAAGTTNWVTVSDLRLKRDIKDLQYGMSQVRELHPVTYRLKEGEDRVRLGLIAQEVQKIVPEVVHTDPSGTLLLDYVSLVPVMINAIQQEEKVIERQQAQIDSLSRGRASPVLASVLPGGALALGLLPLGFVVGRRRRGQRPH